MMPSNALVVSQPVRNFAIAIAVCLFLHLECTLLTSTFEPARADQSATMKSAYKFSMLFGLAGAQVLALACFFNTCCFWFDRDVATIRRALDYIIVAHLQLICTWPFVVGDFPFFRIALAWSLASAASLVLFKLKPKASQDRDEKEEKTQ